jgi:hypothetical protein
MSHGEKCHSQIRIPSDVFRSEWDRIFGARDEFDRAMDRASEMVAGWPQWKQELFRLELTPLKDGDHG